MLPKLMLIDSSYFRLRYVSCLSSLEITLRSKGGDPEKSYAKVATNIGEASIDDGSTYSVSGKR